MLIMQRFRVVYYSQHPTRRLYFLGIHTSLYNYFIPDAIENTVGNLGGNKVRNARWEGWVEYRRIYNGFPEFWLAVFSIALYRIYNRAHA